MWIVIASVILISAQEEPLSDIDAFMEKVLVQRAVNWDDYYNHFCKERAELAIEGSLRGVPIQGFRKEFLWFFRDGYFVRSPVSVDGVAVSEEDRDRPRRNGSNSSRSESAKGSPVAKPSSASSSNRATTSMPVGVSSKGAKW